ncbi:hypothetical protein M404DRAFT_544025 [Pisolithus tinctorius Marx 270]|uniref:Uncharacterized protein n=1 Tax=Pisolithus tinctorius Marx 270 TaxID=870435 RepID=A0A0C3PAF8_PISTI|nr:hypothetical protein M404DRAFT_544025 [Pisolithus tinctorius Marx 270]
MHDQGGTHPAVHNSCRRNTTQYLTCTASPPSPHHFRSVKYSYFARLDHSYSRFLADLLIIPVIDISRRASRKRRCHQSADQTTDYPQLTM